MKSRKNTYKMGGKIKPSYATGGAMPMQSLGLPQASINPSAMQLQSMQTGAATAAGGMGTPYGMIGNMAGSVVESFGQPDQPNYGSSIGGGALGGAGTGAMIGSVVPGIGTAIGAVAGGLIGGVKGLLGSSSKDKQLQAQEEARRKQQEAQIKQQQVQQRLQSYNQNNPGYNYASTFKQGGMINSYPNGGPTNVNLGQAAQQVKLPTNNSWYNYPVVDDPMHYAKEYAKMAKDTANYEIGQSIPFADAVKQTPSLQDVQNTSPIDVYKGVPVTDKNTGETYYYPTFEKNAFNKYVKGLGYNVYAKGGGLKRSEDYGSKKKPYPSINKSDFAGKGRSYPIPTKADAVDALRLAGLHGNDAVKSKVYKKYPSLKKANGGQMNSYTGGGKIQELTRFNPDITSYQSGGSTHETSPYGGIPIGNKGSVESGEIRYGDYIFSDRF